MRLLTWRAGELFQRTHEAEHAWFGQRQRMQHGEHQLDDSGREQPSGERAIRAHQLEKQRDEQRDELEAVMRLLQCRAVRCRRADCL